MSGTKLVRADKLPVRFQIPTTMQGPLWCNAEKRDGKVRVWTTLGVPVTFEPWQRLLVLEEETT